MYKLVLIMVVLLTVGLLSVTACQTNGDKNHAYLPIEGLPPATGEEAPDDIVPTPAGYAYRANVHEQGVENPWPSIETTVVVLGSGSDALNIRYRDYIETEAGEIRNNIIHVTRDGGLFNSQLKLYSAETPQGIALTDGGMGVGLPGATGAVLVVEIDPNVALGQYSFEIGIEVDGRDYGTIPCVVTVIGEPYSGNRGITTTRIKPEPGESGVSVSGLMVRLTLDDLMEKSDAVVIGKVVDIFPSRQVDWEPRDKMIITDVVIEVERYLYGQLPTNHIVIMVRGGRVGETVMWVEDEVVFNLGEEVTLFLSRIESDVVPPEGFDRAEYFRVTGSVQGKFSSREGHILSPEGNLVTFAELEQKMAEAHRAEEEN